MTTPVGAATTSHEEYIPILILGGGPTGTIF
jgi:hypothetical protein